MFTKRDYLAYFRLLLVIEREMEKEGHVLYKKIKNEKARELISRWIADEERHAIIVEKLIKMIR